MSVITDAVYNKLKGDTKLVGTYTNGVPNKDGLLSWVGAGGTYWDPSQGKWVSNLSPAIYTYELDFSEITSSHPEYRDLRGFIVTTGHVTDTSDSAASSKTKKARTITKDIRCFYRQDLDNATPDGTFKEVEAIAERVYELFHRQPLVIPDPDDPLNYAKWQSVMVTCNGPIYIPGEQAKLLTQKIDVMVVTLQFTIQEFK